FVLFDEVFVRSRVQTPVDAADVVARHVTSMLGEVDGRAEIRRPVEPVGEPVDYRAGKQIQLTDPREHSGIDESSSGDCPAFCQSRHFWVLRRRDGRERLERRGGQGELFSTYPPLLPLPPSLPFIPF